MTDKLAVAQLLREIGVYIELKGDNRFRARAYETGARAVEELREELPELVAQQRLTETRGIGPALAAVIAEIVTTGSSQQLEKLRAESPPGVLELAQVPGLTIKKIEQLHTALGIDSIAKLRAACVGGQVRTIKGFGEKTEEKLLAALDRWERRDARVLLVDALEAAEPLAAYLAAHPAAQRVELAGSLRRWRETVSDIDFVVASDDPPAIVEHLAAYGRVATVVERADRDAVVKLSDGLQVELHVVAPQDFATALLRATGSAAHVARLEAIGAERGVGLAVPASSEREVYDRLHLAWIAPELREDDGEIEQAGDGSLATDLISIGDIRGMTHCHTTYSDGRNSVAEMAREAEAMGMQYLTITDHSPAAYYASGVDLDRLQRQWDEIARVQETTTVRLLRGTESDILEDGALDYPDRILEQLDVVIASIHSRLKMDPETMTRRLVNAMKQPVFKIWGHGLGRLVLKRDPIACDVEAVLDAVAESRAAVEINGDPYRLDLAPEWVRKARERGIRFIISTDAHSTTGMHNLRFGVHTARRGWVRRGEVLNALSVEEFKRAVRPAG
ncbi:MAG TPA: DNA polymerase/3'-5' exonuclease PolX [Polyangia bacterium]|nr:DNA polymerase/3'-5' exonuclease PolX [Polyangia bacterium]